MFLQIRAKKLVKNTIEIFRRLRYNWKVAVSFEALFKLLTTAIVLPFSQFLIQAVLRGSGYYYLSLENLSRFAKHPLFILQLLVFLLLIVLYVIMDASAVLFLVDNSYQKNQVTMLQTIRFAFKNTKRVFKRGNRRIILYVLLLIPFMSVGAFGIIFTTITIPSFVTHFMENHRLLIRAGVLLMVLVYAFLIRWIFLLPYFTLEQKNFTQAQKASKALGRNRRIRDGIILAMVQLLFYLLSSLVAAIGIILVLGVAKLFSELHLLNYVYTCAVWGLLMVVLILVAAIGTPVSIISISALFYLNKKSKKEYIVHNALTVERMHERHQRKIHITEGVLFIFTICIVTILIHRTSTLQVNPQVEYLKIMEVTAHRGASEFFPENTMAAFQGAVELGADWIELDVQQSRDGQIFVMHDKNFKRTTGVNMMSWELDYSEISQLDAGSFFSANFAGEQIPLLSDVIDFAILNNVRLNIEIKPFRQEEGLEEGVVDLIKEKNFTDRCVVTSQKYSSLEKVKEYAPDIQTVYVMSFAYGNVNRLTAADAFSMEAASITPSMVSRIHNAGKQVYAWTVNSKKKINRMIDLNVDNIITDRVAIAKQYIYEGRTSTVVQRYVQFLRE